MKPIKADIAFKNGCINTAGAVYHVENLCIALYRTVFTLPAITSGKWFTISDLGGLKTAVHTIDRIDVNGKPRDFQLNGNEASIFVVADDSGQKIIVTKMFLYTIA